MDDDEEDSEMPAEASGKGSPGSANSSAVKYAGDADGRFACKFCPRIFMTRSALGGHISKAHPGKSASYNHKKIVRENRWLERELHQAAMQVYRKRHLTASSGKKQLKTTYKARASDGNSQESLHMPVNRNTVRRIKRELVMNDAKFERLRDRFGLNAVKEPTIDLRHKVKLVQVIEAVHNNASVINIDDEDMKSCSGDSPSLPESSSKHD